MELKIDRAWLDHGGSHLTLTFSLAWRDELPPVLGLSDGQMPPPGFPLLEALLAREVSLLYWGPSEPALPIVSDYFGVVPLPTEAPAVQSRSLLAHRLLTFVASQFNKGREAGPESGRRVER